MQGFDQLLIHTKNTNKIRGVTLILKSVNIEIKGRVDEIERIIPSDTVQIAWITRKSELWQRILGGVLRQAEESDLSVNYHNCEK